MATMKNRTRRVALCTLTAAALVGLTAAPALAAADVSKATAQAVNLNLASGALTLALSNPATAATNDGTGSNAQVDGTPVVTLLNSQTFLEAGALKESAEANQDGSSYGCAGVVSPGGDIQVGANGTTCTATGNGAGGVTLDLGALPGLGGLVALAGGDIKITVDAITAHGQVSGTGPAVLGASVANVKVQLGSGTPITVNIPAGPNQDLLGAALTALLPSLGLLGTAVSNLLTGVVSLTTNYQPAPEPNGNGVYSVSGLHVALLGGGLAVADLAKVTVGPNVESAPGDAFSFQNLPLILAGIALLVAIGLGLRTGARRLRGSIA
jgi:hypothetical protein